MSTARDHPPSVGKVNRDAATKQTRVTIVSKAEDEQVVTGVVMSANEVDRQGDYETPETVASFSEQFAALYENEDADGGIMHAAWPSEWMTLEANGIVGQDFEDADRLPDSVDDTSWAQSWKVTDDGLWELIQDDVIGGFSIGARDVTWSDPMEQADLPQGVGVPDDYPSDAPVYELRDGVIREVSAVDTPAVPDAVIHAKDNGEKGLDEYLGDRDAFLEEVQERGHSMADAERLWDVLTRANEVDGASRPGKTSLFERVGRAAAKALSGGSDSGADDAGGAETQTHTDTQKEGRTLSKRNRDSAKAAVDASLDLLEDAGVQHGMTRFTDKEDDGFDLTEHSARAWSGTTDDTTDDDTESMTDTSETEDDGSGEKNSSTSDPFEDAPAWAESLKETVDENTEQLSELKSSDEGGEDESGEKDEGGEDEAPEWAKALADQVQANAEAVESIGKQSGYSTQVRNNGQDAEGDGEGKDASLANVLRSAGVQ